MQRLREHLTYANVAATLALVIAVAGGTAIAGGKAAKNSVASSSIKPHNVTASDLAGIRVVQVTRPIVRIASCSHGERVIGGGGSSGAPAASDLAVSRPGTADGSSSRAMGPRTGR